MSMALHAHCRHQTAGGLTWAKPVIMPGPTSVSPQTFPVLHCVAQVKAAKETGLFVCKAWIATRHSIYNGSKGGVCLTLAKPLPASVLNAGKGTPYNECAHAHPCLAVSELEPSEPTCPRSMHRLWCCSCTTCNGASLALLGGGASRRSGVLTDLNVGAHIGASDRRGQFKLSESRRR